MCTSFLQVNCTGSQAYLMNGRAIHEIYHTKSYIHDALSKYNQEQLIEDLVPNVNYTCQVASSVADNELVSIVHFKTLVGSKRHLHYLEGFMEIGA